MIGKKLLQVILEEGVSLTDEKQQEVINDIEEAVKNGKLVVLYKEKEVMGFFTYFEKEKEVFINNCIIFGEHRNRTNLLNLRKKFREAYKGCRFSWESLKRQKMVSVK